MHPASDPDPEHRDRDPEHRDPERRDPGAVVHPQDLRAGDTDREQVVARLREAHAEGRLDLAEFDERVAAALAARTYRDLARLTEDLPGGPPAPGSTWLPAGRADPDLPVARPDSDLRSSVVSWAAVSTTTLTIWAISCVASMSFIYPWWIWVAGPWGLVLVFTWIGNRYGRSG